MKNKQNDLAKSLYARMTLQQLEQTRQNLIDGLAVLDEVIAERKTESSFPECEVTV